MYKGQTCDMRPLLLSKKKGNTIHSKEMVSSTCSHYLLSRLLQPCKTDAAYLGSYTTGSQDTAKFPQDIGTVQLLNTDRKTFAWRNLDANTTQSAIMCNSSMERMLEPFTQR